VLPETELEGVFNSVKADITSAGLAVVQSVHSPIKGARGNTEILCRLRPERDLEIEAS
jgi:hypothetical protein